MKMLIAVMSYNRGNFLSNCIRSIEENIKWNYELIIYDDSSTDLETKEVLFDLNKQYLVKVNTPAEAHQKVKGLYENMNHSLRDAASLGCTWLFIIQDDMQIIRPVASTELNVLAQLVDNEIAVPLFFKKNHQKEYIKLLKADDQLKIYRPASVEQTYMNGIADVGLFNVSGLMRRNWVFLNDEGTNIKRGRELGFQRVVFQHPFVAYLPWPATRRLLNSFRGVVKLFTDVYFNAGFHPYKTMSEASIEKLLRKDVWDIPFGEDYLTLQNGEQLTKPWNYYDSTYPLRTTFKKLKRMMV